MKIIEWHFAASMPTKNRQTFISSSQTGYCPHRAAKKKLSADHLALILSPEKSHRFFAMSPITKPQKNYLTFWSKPPLLCPKISADNDDPWLAYRMLIKRSQLINTESLQRLIPNSTITYSNDHG